MSTCMFAAFVCYGLALFGLLFMNWCAVGKIAEMERRLEAIEETNRKLAVYGPTLDEKNWLQLAVRKSKTEANERC